MPAVAHVVSEVGESEPGAAISQFTIQGWAAVLLLQDVVKNISGTVTPGCQLLNGFEHLTIASTDGLYPSYTTTSPGPVPNAPRIFLTKVLILKFENGAETPVSNGFVNVVKGG